MSRSIPSVDLRQDDQIRQVASDIFFINRYAAWTGLSLTHARLPACELPEHYVQQHLMVISLKPESGSERRLDGRLKTENATVGDVAIVPAQVSCWQGITQPMTEGMLLTLEPWRLEQNLEQTTDRNVELIPTFAQPDPLIYGIALALKSAFETQTANSLYIESLEQALTMHLLQHYTTRPQLIQTHAVGLSQQQLQQVTDYIHASLEREIKLADLAALVQMSLYHFCALFKQSIGISPYQYVLQQRIERAKELLRLHQTLTIADIALQCGFSNQSHFTKRFRQRVGTTPKEYRHRV